MGLVARSGALLLALFAAGFASAADPPPAVKDSDAVRKLLRKRLEVLGKAMTAREEEFKAGRATAGDLQDLARLVRDAQLELAGTPAERVAAHLKYFKVARDVDMLMTAKHEAGRVSTTDYLLANAERVAAEIALRRAGGKPPAE